MMDYRSDEVQIANQNSWKSRRGREVLPFGKDDEAVFMLGQARKPGV